MKSRKAFTLIELLVVIAIIGLLATISVLALQNARAKSRDAKRVADMKQVSTALEMFFNDNNRYPTVEEWNTGKLYSTTTGSTSTYMQVIPNAPTPADGSCQNSQNAISYIPSSDGSSYSISFCLGGNTGTLVSGPKCLTPGGVIDADCGVCDEDVQFCDFNNCGDAGNYAGESYSTVLINGKCWFRKNLNIGNFITSDNSQTDNSIKEKYCFEDNDSNCLVYGGLYQWNELMNYNSAEGAQGLCPSGWHIPSSGEFIGMINSLGGESVAGGHLKEAGFDHWDSPNLNADNSSGLTVFGAGYYKGNVGVFPALKISGYLWSSSIISNPVNFFLSKDLESILNFEVTPNYGYSARCVKD